MGRMGMRRVSAALVGVAGLALVMLGMAGAGAGPAYALTNCTVADYSLDGEEQAFLGLINAYRQQNGLNTLVISTNLNRDAAWMVNDLATNNYFAHTDSLGRSAYQRALDCGYPQGAGENLAAGSSWNSAQAAFEAWKASPGHNANMLFQYYQQIGIARLYNAGSTYGWYWATEFGAVNDGTGGAPPPTNTPTPAPATSTPTPSANTPTPVPNTPTPIPTASTQGVVTVTPTPTVSSLGQAPPSTNTPTSGVVTITPTPTRTNTPAATPTPTAAPTGTPAPSLALSPGANLVAWPGGDVEPGVAFKNDPGVLVVYGWDAANGSWLHYGPGLPGFANTLTLLRQGEAYWVISGR